jgi:farnesyl-diphosphate farnesyltransferase
VDPITELVTQTSRTFAVGIRQLPGDLERVVEVAYLMLRVSDYFEDHPSMPGERKIAYLESWAAALRSPQADFEGPDEFDDTTADAKAAREARRILAAFRALPDAERDAVGRHVIGSTEGMARWVATGPAFEAEADLDAYMFEVAGRVGLLLTEVFALRSDRVAERAAALSELGVQFGLGLQTVNVIRGLSSDPERGWIFLPRSFLPDGVEPASLWREASSPDALALLDRLCDKARGHLERAREYILLLPRREYGIRVFCVLPWLFAERTLELSRGNPGVFTSEVKLSRAEVESIGRRTRMWAWSNAWVARTGGLTGR